MNTATPWEAGRFDTRAGPRKVLFGQMYEDVEVERAAFAPGARVFCIASAGDTAMALSAAHVVTAIDINPVQLDYARTRLRGAPAVTGTAERVVGLGRGAMALFGWRRSVLERFLALADPAAQREFWRAHLDTRGFRVATDALLSVAGLKAVYASPFLAILPAHFGQVMRARLARCFGTFPNRDNRYARALLLGELPAAPAFDAARITLVPGDAAAYLEHCAPASFDAFTLSNILDGAPAGYRQRLFAAVRHAASRAHPSCCGASPNRRMRRRTMRPRATARSCGAWSTCAPRRRSTTPAACRSRSSHDARLHAPPRATAPTLADLAKIVELRTKIVSMSSLAIGTLWAAAGGAFSWLTFALMLAATLCVDLATAGFNSYYDHRHGVDTRETDVDGYKVLVHRAIDPRIALRVAFGLFLLAAAFGLALGARVGWEVVGVGVVCMLIAWSYSGGPWPLSRLPVGEVFAGGAMGLVLTALAAYVQTGAVDARTVALGLPAAFLIAAILAANNACDRVGDAAGGRRTLAIVVGERGAARVVDGARRGRVRVRVRAGLRRRVAVVRRASAAGGRRWCPRGCLPRCARADTRIARSSRRWRASRSSSSPTRRASRAVSRSGCCGTDREFAPRAPGDGGCGHGQARRAAFRGCDGARDPCGGTPR